MRLPILNIIKGPFTRPPFSVFTLFITAQCNARCKTCFYWRSLNAIKDPLTLDEYGKIARQMMPFQHLLVTGGEPTLHHQLIEIISLFITSSHQTITMPTNGLQPGKIKEIVEKMLIKFPQNRVLIGVSLDGLKATNDEFRGVASNFDRAVETLHLLGNLKKQFSNLRLTSLTVVFKDNVREIPELFDFIARELPIDYITVEPLRGQPLDPGISPPEPASLKTIQQRALKINYQLLSTNCPAELPLFLSYQIELYKIQLHALTHGKLNIQCLAGQTVGVLEPDGQVRLCELFEPVGNVRDYHYSFKEVWHNEKAKQQRSLIKAGQCCCTHCVNLSHSIPYQSKALQNRLKTQKLIEQALTEKTDINFSAPLTQD